MTAGIRSMTEILSLLGDPPDILVHILRKYEYQSVKSVMRSLTREKGEEPVIWDLGKYALLRPGRDATLKRPSQPVPTRGFCPMLRSHASFPDREHAGSRLLFNARWRWHEAFPRVTAPGVMRIVSLEMTLANAIWALRLRFFFGLDAQAAQPSHALRDDGVPPKSDGGGIRDRG